MYIFLIYSYYNHNKNIILGPGPSAANTLAKHPCGNPTEHKIQNETHDKQIYNHRHNLGERTIPRIVLGIAHDAGKNAAKYT
jgi:hypothetical protein